MTRRSDSDIDLEKFKPTVEASLRLCDEQAAEERLRKAFEDPELRALLAAEGRSVDFTPIPPAPRANGAADTDEAARRAALARNETMDIDPRSLEKVRLMAREREAQAAAGAASIATPLPVTPSPPTKSASAVEKAGAPSATSKAATSSATAPKARPAAEPVEKPVVAMDQPAGQKLPMWTIWTAGASMAAVVLVLVLARSLGEQRTVAAPTATVNPSAAIAVSVSTAVLPIASAAPSAEPTAVAAGATAPVEPSATASTAVPATPRPAGVVPKQHRSPGSANDAPSPPSPPPTVQPQVTATPSAVPNAPPAATTTKPRDPFLLEKQD